MLMIRVLVSWASSSVSIQDPDRNICWSVKLLTDADVRGELREGFREGQDYQREWKLVGELQYTLKQRSQPLTDSVHAMRKCTWLYDRVQDS